MTSGPDHYREAERLLARQQVAHAQVHALLANAAAVAVARAGDMPLADYDGWMDAASANRSVSTQTTGRAEGSSGGEP